MARVGDHSPASTSARASAAVAPAQSRRNAQSDWLDIPSVLGGRRLRSCGHDLLVRDAFLHGRIVCALAHRATVIAGELLDPGSRTLQPAQDLPRPPHQGNICRQRVADRRCAAGVLAASRASSPRAPRSSTEVRAARAPRPPRARARACAFAAFTSPSERPRVLAERFAERVEVRELRLGRRGRAPHRRASPPRRRAPSASPARALRCLPDLVLAAADPSPSASTSGVAPPGPRRRRGLPAARESALRAPRAPGDLLAQTANSPAPARLISAASSSSQRPSPPRVRMASVPPRASSIRHATDRPGNAPPAIYTCPAPGPADMAQGPVLGALLVSIAENALLAQSMLGTSQRRGRALPPAAGSSRRRVWRRARRPRGAVGRCSHASQVKPAASNAASISARAGGSSLGSEVAEHPQRSAFARRARGRVARRG